MEFSDLKDIFKQFLYLPDDEYLDIVFATVLANRIQGDPVWLFIIGSPGSCKTEVLRTLVCEETYHVSKIKPASLISGYVDRRSKVDVDHSLLPKINNKVLIVKDFSTVLEMRHEDRSEVFSILRDAYDGYASVSFGTGEKSYISKFGMIAAMTPAIEIYRVMSSQLGERFLYVRPIVGDSQQLCLTAVNNINGKTHMRKTLSTTAKTFLQDVVIQTLEFPDECKQEIVTYADTTAIMRSYVPRDRMDFNTIAFPPIIEVGTRISQQIMKLYIGLEALKSESMRLIKRILIDCVPINRKLVCESLVQSENATVGALEDKCDMSLKTVRITLADLEKLGLVTSVNASRGEKHYSVIDSVKKLFM